MGQISRECPHCHTVNTAFHAYGEFHHPVDPLITVALRCSGCHRGISALYRRDYNGQNPVPYDGDLDENENFTIIESYPLPDKAVAPGYLPENIEKFFLQAANGLRADDYDASSMMSRKTLDVATKKLAPEFEGKLYNRIEHLAESTLITPDLKSWAHIIRDDGNVAAHEEEPMTEAGAAELLSFVEMFLMYTFTMPGMVKEKWSEDPEDEPADGEA